MVGGEKLVLEFAYSIHAKNFFFPDSPAWVSSVAKLAFMAVFMHAN